MAWGRVISPVMKILGLYVNDLLCTRRPVALDLVLVTDNFCQSGGTCLVIGA